MDSANLALLKQLDIDAGTSGQTPDDAAATLSAATVSVVDPNNPDATIVTQDKLMRSMGWSAFHALMDKAETAAGSDPELSRILDMFKTTGLDWSDPSVRAFIDGLPGSFTAAEKTAMKALGEKLISPAENAGIVPSNISAGHIVAARAS